MFNKLVEDNHLLHSKLVDAIEMHPLVCDFYEWQAKIIIFLNEESMKYGGRSSTHANSVGPLSQWCSDKAEQINSPLPLSIVPIHSDYGAVRARELRPRNKPPKLRSPFIIRAVDITKCISCAHKDLSEWFLHVILCSDELFRTCVGVATE
uniref:Uncharacterized protein n=1 Tax=Lactuca sativa TaxID=4236 RepID=A0A9R1WCJ5_LACSA|nr:hypothetical protein LSAT_V11C200073270 [Lactuca sativa]